MRPHVAQLSKESRALCIDPIVGFAIPSCWYADDRGPHRPIPIERLLVDVVEKSGKGVEVLLRGWIELVIVADGAPNGKSHEGCAISLGPVAGKVEAQFFGDGPAFVRALAHTNVAAGDEGVEVFGGQQVSGDLFRSELIEGFIAVKARMT